MKFPLSWLKDHLETSVSLADLVEAMTMAGLEVEDVDDPAARLAAFTVAHVLAAEKHPDADKLRVCRVATKDGEKQIVCGAPNARAGMTAIFAPLGTFIPGLGFALDAKPRKIRGVESHGMLCSAKEIEAGDDHDGIVDLSGVWAVGAPAAEALGVSDPVIDIEVTPNRPDWLGVRGIARDLAACGLGALKPAPVAPARGAFACPIPIEIEDRGACPAFAGRVVRGLKNGPSPDWLQAKLRAVGLKPRNALVDVTNYLSLDRARPLHVYDASKITGPIRARLGRAGETFKALDGKDYAVSPDHCVIADDARVLGFGGVMGGEYSGSSEATTEVFIESAYFDPNRTARTGRSTGITSDAQYRFARGVDTGFVVEGLELATQLILEMCGGEASEIALAGEIPAPPAPIAFDPARVKQLAGVDLPASEIARILSGLGFDVPKPSAKSWSVGVPTWRRDAEGPADLVEEVVRVYGYDKLPAVSLPRPSGRRAPAITPFQKRVALGRRFLAARGYQEAVTWSFCRADQAVVFGGVAERLALANPISSELDVMRPSALVHLALAAQRNADRGFPHLALFEVGPIFEGPAANEQKTVAAGVRRPEAVRAWTGATAPDVFSLKADVLAALEAMGAPIGSVQLVQSASSWWRPGRSARLQLGPKTVLAEFGELHPRALKALDVAEGLLAFEIVIDAIPLAKAAGATRAAYQPSDLMPVSRDFAFVVDLETPADTLVRAAVGADKTLVAGARVFDVYAGPNLGAGKKSLALEVTLQPKEATLDDAALEAVTAKIVKAVEKASGGSLRG